MSSIQVNVNSQEMDLVIERGNSLNVVYNDDLMATKSDCKLWLRIFCRYSHHIMHVSINTIFIAYQFKRFKLIIGYQYIA